MSKSGVLRWIVVISVLIIALGGVWLWQESRKEARQASPSSVGKISFSHAVGQRAPNFSLPDIKGREVTLSSLRGRVVVLFFAEGLMCLPCVTQVVALSTDERLNSESVVSYGIVIDSRENWRRSLKDTDSVNALFDSDGKVSQSYSVLNLPSSMHKGKNSGHTYFVIDREGIIRFAIDDPSMGIRNEGLVQEVERLTSRQ
ncbi:MAG: redoxin domain-containing protein [Chloroflexi bacterium]|nr:redoxin domain-containing protein [Chloroflexota bacterium]